ncbi:MAG: DUF1330 domain-containing protein [Candidatus Omnitrophica bacterium]|nr:DUF1330 domain-containing protein [Candidatus Omnitrophota bacterium]
MPVYFIVEIKVKRNKKSKCAYGQYVRQVPAIVEKYKGKYLARGSQVIPVFGNWKPGRIVIIEFPAARYIKKWLSSSEYKTLAVLREKSTFTNAIIVKGVGY